MIDNKKPPLRGSHENSTQSKIEAYNVNFMRRYLLIQ